MFGKIAKAPSKKAKSTFEMSKTILFLQAVVDHGARLSYGALAGAAKALDKDGSNQIPAQRGASLVGSLPAALQPFICRKAGGYHRDASSKWTVDAPQDLTSRPVIDAGGLTEAIKEWKTSLTKPAADAS
jgi:hypothetical protein